MKFSQAALVVLAAVPWPVSAFQAAAAFQRQPPTQSRQRNRNRSLQQLQAFSPLLLLQDVSTSSSSLLLSDSIAENTGDVTLTLDTFNALNGAMADSVTTTATEAFDPSIALAGAVAAAALIGLLTMNMSSTETSSGVASTSQLYPSKPKDSKATTKDTERKSANKAAVLEKPKTNEKKEVEEEEPVVVVDSFADVTEAREALSAFDQGSRSGLLSSLGRLTGIVRSSRRELQKETTLRQQAEANLKMVAEELRDVEDKYELGQNDLNKVNKELQFTKSDLTKTLQQLEETATSLEELQEERKSLRKLGVVAWRLSKDRVKTRIQKIRGKSQEEDNNGDDKKKEEES